MFKGRRSTSRAPRNTRPALEPLECRIVMAASVELWRGSLIIDMKTAGTRTSLNTVTVSQSGNTLRVVANGKPFAFKAAAVKGVVYWGHEGKDRFANLTSVRALAYGF